MSTWIFNKMQYKVLHTLPNKDQDRIQSCWFLWWLCPKFIKVLDHSQEGFTKSGYLFVRIYFAEDNKGLAEKSETLFWDEMEEKLLFMYKQSIEVTLHSSLSAGRMALMGLPGEETRVLIQWDSASVSGLALALLTLVCAQMSVLLQPWPKH